MTEYVCGLMFSTNRQNVLLIEKDRPEWQAGKFNAVGGKIEEEDKWSATKLNVVANEPKYCYSLLAIIREFKEEVGIDTLPEDWELFCICEGTDSRIYYFRAFSDKLMDFKQMESEEPMVLPANDIRFRETVPNLQFLVPMALWTNELFTIKCNIKGGTKHEKS